MMDATATRTDVSGPTTVGFREYLSGARLLVGTIAASALMLLACSWFALGTGVFGASRDVGEPDPVRIGGSTPAQAATGPRSDVAHVGARPGGAVTPRPHGSRATSPRSVGSVNEGGAQSEAATGPAPVPAGAKPSSSAPPATSSPVASTPPQTVVPEVEVTLPAPLDQVDVPSLPPLPLTPPSLPPVQVSAGPVTVGIP